MHIQNKQANKHYVRSDPARRASAGCTANNNDSAWHHMNDSKAEEVSTGWLQK